MDLNSITQALNTLNQQNWLSGIKAGLAIVACVFLYMETQAHVVTDEIRKKILSRMPLVLLGGGALIYGLGELGKHSKMLASFKDGTWPLIGVFAALCGLFAYAVRSISNGRLQERAKQVIGVVFATLAIICFFLFFHLSYKGYYHRWEFFHYYMGSKYAKELSYERIYVCSAIADAETGNAKDVKHRKMRDLRIDMLMPSTEVLAHPEQCKNLFTPERWEDFKKDLTFFRQKSGRSYWNDMQKDHGYNPPPVWTIGGHYLSIIEPAADGFFKLLSAIDVVFTGLLFIAIGWAFGWRATVIAAIYWGVQEPAPFYWTGGAFLRQDWFLLAVLAVCLVRKRYFFWAGVALTYAGLLRVFPILLWAGPLMMIAFDIWRHRRLAPKYRNMLAGGLLAVAVLVPWSVHVAGLESYREFYHHIQVHNGTPLTNHMGLKTVIVTAPDQRMKFTRDNRLLDPFERWKNLRKARFNTYKPVYYGACLLFLGLFAWVVRKLNSTWISMGLSLIFVVSFVEATCYYYSIWIVAALLTRAKRTMEWPLLAVLIGILTFVWISVLHRAFGLNDLGALVVGVGTMSMLVYWGFNSLMEFARTKGSMEIAVVGLGAASQLLTVQFGFIDDKFTAISALYVAWTLAFLLAFFRRPEPHLAVEPLPARLT